MKNGNAEVCVRTGREANARFEQNGLGWAWYESRYDTRNWVVMRGDLVGPLSDDEIDKALARGEIAVCGSDRTGQLQPSELAPGVAERLFEIGVEEQISASRTPEDAAEAQKGIVIGMLVDRTQAPAVPPSWHRYSAHRLRAAMTTGSGEPHDFQLAGQFWAMSVMAAGLDPTDRTARDHAAAEALAYGLAMERALAASRKLEQAAVRELRRQIDGVHAAQAARNACST